MVKDLAGNSAANSSTVNVDVAVPEFPPTVMLLLFVLFASASACGFRQRPAKKNAPSAPYGAVSKTKFK